MLKEILDRIKKELKENPGSFFSTRKKKLRSSSKRF